MFAVALQKKLFCARVAAMVALAGPVPVYNEVVAVILLLATAGVFLLMVFVAAEI